MRCVAGPWTVDLIELSYTVNGSPASFAYGGSRDGAWFRVRYHGTHIADVKSLDELKQLGVPVTELQEK